jgi:hypothetical protein
MKSSTHKWYAPVFLFAWALGWIYFCVHLLAGGEEWFAWHRGAQSILLRPDTHPYYFWGCVAASFVLAFIGVWAGIAELRRYMRQQRPASPSTMQELQKRLISKK